MKIKGLKHLNSNFYDYIMIRNLYNEETKVELNSDLKIDTLKMGKTFYDTIKKLEEKEKIKEIIRYYLRNNEIFSLKDMCKIKHYDGYFTIIEGSRNLYLQLKEDSLDKEILKEIKEKYIKDRDKYVSNNVFNKIEVSCYDKEMYCYLDKYRNDSENVLDITLKVDNKKLLDFEEEFILNYINYLFNQSDKKIYYRTVGISIYMYKHFDTLKFGEFPGLYFYNDDFIIKVNESLFSDIYYLMDKHNKELENIKKLQLTINDLQK